MHKLEQSNVLTLIIGDTKINKIDLHKLNLLGFKHYVHIPFFKVKSLDVIKTETNKDGAVLITSSNTLNYLNNNIKKDQLILTYFQSIFDLLKANDFTNLKLFQNLEQLLQSNCIKNELFYICGKKIRQYNIDLILKYKNDCHFIKVYELIENNLSNFKKIFSNQHIFINSMQGIEFFFKHISININNNCKFITKSLFLKNQILKNNNTAIIALLD